MSGLESKLGAAGRMILVVGAALVVSCGSAPSPSPVCLAGAELTGSGECEPRQADTHYIPFPAGQEVRVTQGYHGYETHQESVAFAVDFACEAGDRVVASRSGVVWSVRDDSDESCPDEECIDDANYVIIDHGDGTFSTYYHLKHKGAFVEPGDRVCGGQLIGQCGDTGYATGHHLHFSVLNTQWKTIPVSFAEARDEAAGVPLPREHYVSQNQRQPYCEETDYSRLGTDAFAHRGIELETEIPTVVDDHEGRQMRIEGTYHGDRSHVAVHRRRVGAGSWIEQCGAVDEDGRFSFVVDWPEHVFTDGYYFLMLTGSDEECSAPGWAWAYRLRFRTSEVPEDGR